MADLIDRRVAIKAIEDLQDCYNGFSDSYDKACIIGVLEEVPSAQPEPIRVNLNEQIKVKLTDWGKEIYYHQFDKINQIAGREICKPMFPKEDENGYTRFQLWDFIQLYGKHIGMAFPNVIEPIEIIYEAEAKGEQE